MAKQSDYLLATLLAAIVLALNCCHGQQRTNVGLIFESTTPEMERIFEKALDDANQGNDDVKLSPVTAAISPGNAFETSKRLCKMLRSSVIAVFGPPSPLAAAHAMSICDAKEMPFMDTRWDFSTQLPTINLHPHPTQLAAALKDLVVWLEWEGFTILYETGEYLPIVNELLQLYDTNGPTVTVRRYELDINGNYRNVLRRVKRSEEYSIVIVGSIETLPDLLMQAQQVGILTGAYRYIIGNLDMQTIDLEPFQHGDANITGIRLISPENPKVVEILKSFDGSADNPFQNVSVPCPMSVSMALVYDGVQLLAETFKHAMFRPLQLNCNTGSTWDKGYTLVNYMKSLSIVGISGEIKFDYQGLRTDFSLELVELTTSGLTPIGTWSSSSGFVVDRKPPPIIDIDQRSLVNKSFLVLTALSEPYGMLKDVAVKLEGNDRYEGFGIDLIAELANRLGFKYTFKLQPDNKYGTLDEKTKTWNGMLLELMEDRADLAITDLTMTSERESAVDFTIPFMNLGIGVLYRKPTKQPPKLFSFMSPFSGGVWLLLGVAYLSVSVSFFVLGRMSPVEWDNPYPCIEEPTELENQFSFANSLWFTVGALLQQGSEMAPKAPSTRAVASIWWFFTLILVASYTANLAAFLTVESLSTPIESAEDLAAGKGNVMYGAKNEGSTIKFFEGAQYPPYKKMYEYMKENPQYLTDSNADGVRRAETENYAFLMESTSIEYNVERRCTLTQVGSLLDEKGYGIAMKKNSPYRDILSQAVLELQEQGVLTKMKTKWWKEKRGGGACSDTKTEGGALALELSNLGGIYLVLIGGSFFAVLVAILEMIIGVKSRCDENKQAARAESAAALGMANLGGVFLVVFVGCILASIYGILEWLIRLYITSRRYKVSFMKELWEEILFIIRCSGNTKKVKYAKTARSTNSRSSSKRSSVTLNSLPTDNLDDSKAHNYSDRSHNQK